MEWPKILASVGINRVTYSKQLDYCKNGGNRVTYAGRIGDVSAVASFSQNAHCISLTSFLSGKVNDIGFSNFRPEQRQVQCLAYMVYPHGSRSIYDYSSLSVMCHGFPQKAFLGECIFLPDFKGCLGYYTQGKYVLGLYRFG